MIAKLVSVSIAGWVALVVTLLFVGSVTVSGLAGRETPPDWLAGALFLTMCVSFWWWVLGTALHRSRLNRRRYDGHVASQPEFPPAPARGRANPWRPWEG